MASVKDTNPKDAVGIKKVPYHVLPQQVLAELGLALMEGARKYGSYNWRVAGVRASVYFDALQRHLAAWWEGQDIDPDSGVHHITKAIACLLVLRDSQLMGNHTDDRPPNVVDQEWLADANKKAAAIIERYPDAVPPNTQAGQRGILDILIEMDTTNGGPYNPPSTHRVKIDPDRLVSYLTPLLLDTPPAHGPSVTYSREGNRVVIREYDCDGVCVRETAQPQSKEDALNECVQRWGVEFETE